MKSTEPESEKIVVTLQNGGRVKDGNCYVYLNSLHTHDFVSHNGGFVDGGLGYIRTSLPAEDLLTVTSNMTFHQMHQRWLIRTGEKDPWILLSEATRDQCLQAFNSLPKNGGYVICLARSLIHYHLCHHCPSYTA